jgi:predicted transcriptional regulator
MHACRCFKVKDIGQKRKNLQSDLCTLRNGEDYAKPFVAVVSQSHTFITNASLLDKELKVLRAMKRNRFEIIADILETAKDGAKKTRIMYRCNLSYRQTKKLVSHLLETGLLTVGSSYHTTEKGLQFLKAYHTLELLLNTRN